MMVMKHCTNYKEIKYDEQSSFKNIDLRENLMWINREINLYVFPGKNNKKTNIIQRNIQNSFSL